MLRRHVVQMGYHYAATARKVLPSISTVNFPPCHFFSAANDIPHKELRKDVSKLGGILGEVISATPGHGPATFETVEKMRMFAKNWRANGALAEELGGLVDIAENLSSEEIQNVARAYSHFLTLANTAEVHHRVRRLRRRECDGRNPHDNSVEGTLAKLTSEGITADQIFDALSTQKLEVVLTAHPTEVNRRTNIRKFRQIDLALAELDRQDLSATERETHEEAIRRNVEALWWSDEIRRIKPTPFKEARGGINILTESLWHSVPAFLRQMDRALMATINKTLPPTTVPLKFSSWMGGDRDGNPFVTPAMTRSVHIASRLAGATLVKTCIKKLGGELSVGSSKATPELIRLLTDENTQAEDKGVLQPYTLLIRQVEARLELTIEMLEAGVVNPTAAHEGPTGLTPLTESAELLTILVTAYESLCASGLTRLADGSLRDLIRQVSCFGLCLLPLDIRQESTRHAEALDAVTRYLGVGGYLDWDESERREWLLKELSAKRPLLPVCEDEAGYAALGPMFDPIVCDTLATFDMIATLPSESLGAYVISMSRAASDVLAVRLLQKHAGVKSPLRVVPLFETLDDLMNSEQIMDSLWSEPWYKKDTAATQEVMIGYSDSAKDAGRLAAAWAQYTTQEKLAAAASKHGINLTFFHGKGGTVSRGGDPSVYRAIAAQPHDTVNGRFRITEQGEVITQNYAHPAIAKRHLDVYTAALLNERFLSVKSRHASEDWRALMDRLSEASCSSYRSVVRGEPTFIPYFRSATPELELAQLNIGSRPAKRRPTGGVETLRAIPWVFAWTQTRLNLTSWLGIGAALNGLGTADKETLGVMYSRWPWFEAFVDVIDMVMAKSSASIASNYDKQLVASSREDSSELLSLGEKLRGELSITRNEILSLRGYSTPQQDNGILLPGMKVRDPYMDPLNVLQAEILKRLRSDDNISEDERIVLEDSLTITISGIANGQKSTG
uniref:phosphoenolpyruvate carboxylase n=1 Tax=Octactis speculum TaxID=3111310 RepID=A0A7S2CUJ2_9STRA|mmetsp:Transcript_39838/g.54248  ORF Transcript_39838/g.54248 Transcript_39838/m.54248 type:complete len:961 (+) Transcript_39838:43-2925(+)